MLQRQQQQQRHGAAVVENAVVLPAFFIIIIGLLVGTLGVFRYQQVASLAREASRYASVRGATYAQSTNQAAATPKQIYDNAVVPNAVGLDLKRLKYEVTWSPDNRQGGQVTVKLTYRWIPEAFLNGMDLSSTSTVTITY